jgi:hypothetical protein
MNKGKLKIKCENRSKEIVNKLLKIVEILLELSQFTIVAGKVCGYFT